MATQRGRGGCSSGGEGLRPRPQNNVRPRPTADNFPTKAGVERWRAVGARCSWRNRLARRYDGVATGVAIGWRARP